jgi:putative endonuclease
MLVRVQLPSWVRKALNHSGLFLFMFYVYILKSKIRGRFYIGYSENPDQRLVEHNSGKAPSTKPYRPWEKVYQEEFTSAVDALRREREIKSKKSKKYIEWLIGQTRPDEDRDEQ